MNGKVTCEVTISGTDGSNIIRSIQLKVRELWGNRDRRGLPKDFEQNYSEDPMIPATNVESGMIIVV